MGYQAEYYLKNRERIIEKQRQYDEAHPDKKRENNLKRLYGIDLKKFEEILAAQGGRCGICRADEAGGRGRWHVDHDHQTGVVRGLLCHDCNTGLGKFKDDRDLLLKALEYLGGKDGR